MNLFNKNILFGIGLLTLVGIATLYGMELHNKDYYKQHFMRTIEHRNEDPADFAQRQLNHVEENSPQWQALQEIIQEHTPQATTTTTTTAQEKLREKGLSVESAALLLKHLKISQDQQKIPIRHANSLIWVKTSDGKTIELKKWQIDEMRLLHVLLADQQEPNSPDNPLIVPQSVALTAEDLTLMSTALDKAASGEFNDFYDELYNEYENTLQNKTIGEGSLRKLLNIAQKVEADGMSALFAQHVFMGSFAPEIIAKDMLNAIHNYFINYMQFSLIGHPDNVNVAVFSKNNKYIASGCHAARANCFIWNASTGKKIGGILQADNVTALDFSPDSTEIASGNYGTENNLILYNIENRNQLRNLIGDEDGISCVQFSPDGTRLASGGFGPDNNLMIWDVKSGTLMRNLVGHSNLITSVKFNPTGDRMVSACMIDENNRSPNLLVWDVESGEIIHNLVGHPDDVYAAEFSPDGTKIVSAGFGNTNNLIVWDVNTGKQLHNLTGHSIAVRDAHFHPNGNTIISGGASKTNNLIMWNTQSGQQIHNLVGHDNSVHTVVYSPDGRYIASGSLGNHDNCMIWNAATGDRLYNLIGHNHSINKVTFDPDSKRLVSCSDGKTDNLILWDLMVPFATAPLDLEQAQTLYQWYLAAKSGHSPHISEGTRTYAVYQSLPDYAKKLAREILHLTIESTKEAGQ